MINPKIKGNGVCSFLVHPINFSSVMMTNKQWFILVALFITPFPIAEAYYFFSDKLINPWWQEGYNYPVTVKYYVDKMADNVLPIFYYGTLLLFREVQRLTLFKLGAVVNTVYAVFDLFMYLVNHNSAHSYIFAYSCIFLLAIIAFWILGEFKKLNEILGQTKHKIESKEIYQ